MFVKQQNADHNKNIAAKWVAQSIPAHGSGAQDLMAMGQNYWIMERGILNLLT